jgi:hypothetical protein
MRKINFRVNSIPVALFMVCLVSYGLLIPWLGFYWDDWPYSWFAKILGPLGFVKAFANDRPFLSVIYMVTTPLFGDSPIAWQFFGIFTRFVAVIALWWSLKQIWPKKIRQIAWVTFLFAVFPGFGQQWISVIYSQAFLMLAASIFALGLMVKAYRTPRWYWPLTILSLLCSAFSLLSTEYFYGLEFLRPVFLWIVITNVVQDRKKRAIQILVQWLPYLVALAGYSIYRFMLLSSSTYNGYEVKVFDFSSGGLNTPLVQTLSSLFDSLGKAGFAAWTQTLQLFSLPIEASSTLLFLVVTILTFALTLAYLLLLKTDANQDSDPANEQVDQWGLQAIMIGIMGILLGRLPSWVAGLPIGLDFPWDRFMLSMMLGASFLMVGLIEYLIKTEKRKAVILALLIGLAAGKQTQNANSFRRAWETERSFFWQLTWRMPGIKPGTMLLTDELPLPYYSDYSLSAPLNLIYAPNLKPSDSMPYILLYTKARLNKSLPTLAPDKPVQFNYRAMSFIGNTSQSVVIDQPIPGCLRVMDEKYNDQQTIPDLPDELKAAIHLSNLKNILPDANPPAVPPANLFGSEPSHTWCYYFEKIELAKQSGDWQKVIEIRNQAGNLGFTALLPTEELPLLEAYTHTNQYDSAIQLTQKLSEGNPAFISGLCHVWNRAIDDLPPDPGSRLKINILLTQLKCG